MRMVAFLSSLILATAAGIYVGIWMSDMDVPADVRIAVTAWNLAIITMIAVTGQRGTK